MASPSSNPTRPLEIVRPARVKPQLRKRSRGGVRSARISATKILRDGTRVPLGVISAWHANPIVRLWWRARVWLNRRRSAV